MLQNLQMHWSLVCYIIYNQPKSEPMFKSRDPIDKLVRSIYVRQDSHKQISQHYLVSLYSKLFTTETHLQQHQYSMTVQLDSGSLKLNQTNVSVFSFGCVFLVKTKVHLITIYKLISKQCLVISGAMISQIDIHFSCDNIFNWT